MIWIFVALLAKGGGERTRKVSAEIIKMSIIIDEMRIFCAVELHMLWRVGEKQMTDWMIEIDAIESCVGYKYKKKLRQSTYIVQRECACTGRNSFHVEFITLFYVATELN